MADATPAAPSPNDPPSKRELRVDLTLQTLVILIGIVGSLATGANWVITSAWGQAAARVDGGIKIVETKLEEHEKVEQARLDAHMREEQIDREALRKQLEAVQTEQRETRALQIRQLEEQRAIGDYLTTGRKPAILDRPLPKLDHPKDGGR